MVTIPAINYPAVAKAYINYFFGLLTIMHLVIISVSARLTDKPTHA